MKNGWYKLEYQEGFYNFLKPNNQFIYVEDDSIVVVYEKSDNDKNIRIVSDKNMEKEKAFDGLGVS